MTKTLSLLLGVLVLAAPITVRAQDQNPDYQYATNADGSGVTITAYVGPGGGNVVVPNTIEGLPVTSIGNKAFEETSITGITIPDTVTNIGSFAFFNCNGLTNVNMPGTVGTIQDSTFGYCTALTEFTIPEGVTNIGALAFSECISLVTVIIPDTVTIIGDSAFLDCESLANLILPNGVRSIGVTAFDNCTGLTSLTIPGSVGEISFEAFELCTGLTNITMEAGITNIDQSAFEYCVSLYDLNFPDTLVSIGGEAFQACGNLTNLVIPATVTSIGNVAFFDCSSLTNLYFQGNAPIPGSSVFLYDTNAHAYYLPGTTGWKRTYAGVPALLTPEYIIRVAALPVRAGATVTGTGHYARNMTVNATVSWTNECYQFLGWTYLGKVVSPEPQYTFTALKSETLTASFAWIEYNITASSSPSNWGIVIGGGKKLCGSSDIVHAVAKPGFQFTGWSSSVGPITNASYKFSVGGNETFVANFIDLQLPTVAFSAPLANQTVKTTAYTIRGRTTHSPAVAAVYYNLNQTGWQPVSTTDAFAIWSAKVELTPNSVNTLSAYAVDALGNVGPTNQIDFTCTAQ